MQYPKTGIGAISESDIIVDADWWRGGICPLANACCFLSKYVWKSADGMALNGSPRFFGAYTPNSAARSSLHGVWGA